MSFAAISIPPEVLALGSLNGLAYGLLAVGLVLVFRASRVINFAHGQIGAVAAVALAIAVQRWGMPYWVALVLALALGALVAAAVELVVVRRLRRATTLITMVGTIGAGQVLLFLTGALARQLGSTPLFPQPPGLPSTRFGALLITPASWGMLILAPLAAGALTLTLQRTRLGAAIRASAVSPEGARVLGIRAPRMTTIAWGLAGALSTLTSVLVLPAAAGSVGGDAFGPSLLLRALAAAALAGMSSLPLAFGAGILIGTIEEALNWNWPGTGLPELMLFVLIALGLLMRPGALARLREREDWTALVGLQRLPREVRAIPLVRFAGPVAGALLLLAAALLPLILSAPDDVTLTSVVCFATVAVSAWLLIGLGGQLSLAQFALAGIGAVFTSVIASAFGSPVLGLLAAPVAGAASAVVISLPALRLPGTVLAVPTLGFALAAETWLLPRSWALGQGGVAIPHIAPFDTARGAYWLALLVLAGSTLAVVNLSRGSFGRRLRAVRDNDLAARSLGITAGALRLQAAAVSGAIAGLAGAALGLALFQVSAASFTANSSIQVVGAGALGGLSSVLGPLLGSVYIVALPGFVHLSSAMLAATAGGWLVLILAVPGGLIAALQPLRRRLLGTLLSLAGHDRSLLDRTESPALDAPTAPGTLLSRAAGAPSSSGASLTIEGLVKHFGGVRALDGVSLTVEPGQVVGIIGPNGAGKTTLFDVASGIVAPSAGRVLLDGQEITYLPTSLRARQGLVRSFQDVTLFPTLTVAEVVTLSAERHRPVGLLSSLFGLSRAEKLLGRQAGDLISAMGLERWAETRVCELSTGTRRLAELTCLLALEPKVVLLDEPTAGLAQREAEALMRLLRSLQQRTRMTMLVIEHDLPLVLELADRLAVLAAGQIVVEGKPDEVRRDPRTLETMGLRERDARLQVSAATPPGLSDAAAL